MIQRLRFSEIKVPLVVLTGQGDEQMSVQLIKAGATDYLSKSRISPENLAQVLRSAIRIYRAEMQAALAKDSLEKVMKNSFVRTKNWRGNKNRFKCKTLSCWRHHG